VKNIHVSVRGILWIPYLLSFKHRTYNFFLYLKQNKRRTRQYCSLTGASHGLAPGVSHWMTLLVWDTAIGKKLLHDVTTQSTTSYAKRARCARTLMVLFQLSQFGGHVTLGTQNYDHHTSVGTAVTWYSLREFLFLFCPWNFKIW
jgi:hypothetical protein